MTNEEAIKELKIVREDYWDEYGDPMPALDMAIKALEQQPCEDTISRQAAIDALDRFSLGETDAIKLAFRMGDYLKRLPFAQPEQRWISCSERLPSKADHTDDMVLVCYRNGSVRFDTYMSGWVQGNPVAWMPLPEPYREGRWEE